MDGIIVIDKPGGLTSHQVVASIRKIFPGLKAGHTGTLDPMATGVLPICLGKATRVAEYVVELPKTYRAEVVLGKTSDTEDATGLITGQFDGELPGRDKIIEIMKGYTGEIEQLPPFYSAVKHKGKPLYHWTRRGKTVPRRVRRASIYSLELLEYNNKSEPHLIFEVSCSRGTYIRTLSADIGSSLGCGAYMSALKRLAVGPFTLENSFSLETVANMVLNGKSEDVVRPVDSALQHYKKLDLDDTEVEWLKNGRVLVPDDQSIFHRISISETVRFYNRIDNLKGLASICEVDGRLGLKTMKYLARDEV